MSQLLIEARTTSNAASDAFVILEWCSLLLQAATVHTVIWERWGLDLVQADALALDRCISTGSKEGLRRSAVIVTRRAFRKICYSSTLGIAAVDAAISRLCAKGSASTAANSLLLGLIAGVVSRLRDHEESKAAFSRRKPDYLGFYTREIVGSRTILPPRQASGLADFFTSWAEPDDLTKEVIPAVEKALLRAPEVMLSGPLQLLLTSLPPNIDLSTILLSTLLKPLLSAGKSSNVDIRNGALRAFVEAAKRSHDSGFLEKLVDELINPIKQGKVAAADQRLLHVQMLASLPLTGSILESITSTLAQVALKEPNEAAASAEVMALSSYTGSIAGQGLNIPTAVADAYKKGLSDKKLPIRKAWAIGAAEVLWPLDDSTVHQANLNPFITAVLTAMLESFNEVVANPLPSVQTGLVTVAYIFTSLALTRFRESRDESVRSILRKTAFEKALLVAEPKPSFLLNFRIYSKLSRPDDLTWCLRALSGSSELIAAVAQDPNTEDGWSQAFIYLITGTSIPSPIDREAKKELAKVYLKHPQRIAQIIISGLWRWRRRIALSDKDSAAFAARSGTNELGAVLKSICLPEQDRQELGLDGYDRVVVSQLIDLLVLTRPELIQRANWISACLRTGNDPGDVATGHLERCLVEIEKYTGSLPENADDADRHLAACAAAADLAFVAPNAAIPAILQILQQCLDISQLDGIGPIEAGIFRSTGDSPFVDVLGSKGPQSIIDKNVKDYDTLKWEAELRAQIASKTGSKKKLTAAEQTKVNEQLSKERKIREDVTSKAISLRRGVGIVRGLATGPPTEAERWIVTAIDLLIGIIDAGAGLILDDAAASAYIACADRTSHRLGTLRPFIGIATLRSIGVTQLPTESQQEPLGALVTRVLYRVRMLGEQVPFDTVSLAYILPLVFLVLDEGGVSVDQAEEADEQLILALEFLSQHAEACSDPRLPRAKLLSSLVQAMRRFTQHYELLKTCLNDVVRGISANITTEEQSVLLKATIASERNLRNATLQAIDAELDLSELELSEEIWIACHDEVEENREVALAIWDESEMSTMETTPENTVPYLEHPDRMMRRAAGTALAKAITQHPETFSAVVAKLENLYAERARPLVPEKDKFGMIVKKDLKDPWEVRDGIAYAFAGMGTTFKSSALVPFVHFLIENGALADRNDTVRNGFIDAASNLITLNGEGQVESLMQLFEEFLEGPDRNSKTFDKVNEAVIILYGATARHLPSGDARLPKVVQRLLITLQTPSEDVQYAVSMCLPPLVQASKETAGDYIEQMMDELLKARTYPAQRGAAYGLAGIVKGRGVSSLREFRVMSSLKDASDSKKDVTARQGAFLGYELLSMILGRVFEPYAIQVVPQLLAGFADPVQDVRDACRDSSQQFNRTLSSFAVQRILPLLLEGLEESQWRSKKGACEMLGTMSHLSPEQLAVRLPDIIPPLTATLNDSHKEVRASANSALKQFGEVISNPEIKSVVSVLLKALSDPTKYTDEALDALIKVQFLHFLDAPSLALVVRILNRGLGDRSATKKKSAQIIASLAHLTERKDILPHLPSLVAGLRIAVVDPVPATRATAAKALGSLMEKLGEDALPDLIPSLMSTLKTDSGAGDRMGSAQALSEVLAGLGTTRLEETLPTILQNAQSAKSTVREGFMSLFMYLPLCFGNSFAGYLSKIIPPILAGLADDVESIRDTALKAGRLLVKNFASRAVELLLPELEQGLADDSHRIRLSSVELVGDLLFNLTGISVKADQEDDEDHAQEAGASLLEVLGEERRNKVLSALFICRCDTSGLVRSEAIKVWKSLVASPRTLKELIPTLTQLIIRRLASSNMEQKVIAGNALGELIRKAGEGVMTALLPTLEEGLQTSTDIDERQGICIALRELISSAAPETLEEYEKTLISVIRTALVDPNEDVREAAAEAFDSLQRMLGKRAVDQVLPHLLNLLRTPEEADNALSALLTLLTDAARSNIILPNLLPTLLTSPMSAFNARAIASLSEVASNAMVRRLPNIINAIVDNIIVCKDEALRSELDASLDAVLLSVDENDGLSAAMHVMLTLAKHDDHRRRYVTDVHLATLFAKSEIDMSRYYPNLIRALLIAFDDSDKEVVKAAWTALSELTKRLRKEEMESLVVSTRQVLLQVGVSGSNLPGFGLPKGINAILPIFLQGLMNGTQEQRVQAALAISDVIDRTDGDSLKPFVTQITGPLIRVVSERSVEVKSAILFTLNNLLEKIPTFLKPFLPQLQRTFAKSLADTSSETLRTRAAKALGTLITMTPRIDPLIAELVTGSKTTDAGVKTAMLKALYEVVSKAGGSMNEASRNSILSLIDTEHEGEEDSMAITNARLLGALIKVLPADAASSLIKGRVLTAHATKESVLALNAILVDSPGTLADSFTEETVASISKGIRDPRPVVADNCVLAAGKYLLSEPTDTSFEVTKPLFESLAQLIEPGNSVDTRRFSLVVIRTVSRIHNELVRPHLALLAPPIFASVRDMVIPVKLSAEAAFLAIFSVVDEDAAVFEKYMAGPGASLPAGPKRSMQEYFKRIATKLGAQARDRKEAEGGQGGLGLSGDELEDEKEVWSVGKVDLSDGSFGDV